MYNRIPGLASTLLLNIFYRDRFEGLSDIVVSNLIIGLSYNVFSYADNLLVAV